MKRALLVILLVLFADQALKVWVKLTFAYQDSITLAGDWAYLFFIENRGMAFGLEFGGDSGKLILTLLRIGAVFAIGYGLRRMVQHGSRPWQVVSVALVFAGALGNIIDSTFYGLLFSASVNGEPAVFLPADGGYAPIFHGAVVDMFYFPLWEGRLPEWLPIWGGQHFEFFQPVFNLADAAITTGITLFILSHRRQRKQTEAPAAIEPKTDFPIADTGSVAPAEPSEAN